MHKTKYLSLAFWALLAHTTWGQSHAPCPEANARQDRAQLGISLAKVALQQMRPASNCTVWASGTLGPKPYLFYAYTDGRIIDSISQPGNTAQHLLLRVPQGALMIQLGPIEQGLQGNLYTPPAGLIPAQRQAFVQSFQAVPGLDILPPAPPSLDPKQAEAYQKRRYHLLAAGTYANQIALLVRRVQYPCLSDLPACCRKTPQQTYYLVQAPLTAQGLPQLKAATWQILPAEACPPPQPTCGASSLPWAAEVGVGVLHQQQPVAYVGAGAWVVNTGAALVRISATNITKLPLPKNWRPSQMWLEGILSDEARQVPQLLVRMGGFVEEGEAGEAFARKKRFRIGSLQALPLPELPKGTHAAQMATLVWPDPDQLLLRNPIGYADGAWWLSGTGLVRPTLE